MPQLFCEVSTCAHYNDNYCCKEKIQVDGRQADAQDSTSCKSFYPKAEGFTNSVEAQHSVPQQQVGVSCMAEKCVYNTQHICTADKIEITGEDAESHEDTLCSTFRRD
ncbi:DUF1540 domain-containing protein [Acetanaerobacterium elongatum]|uniref:DUF1540 domain-containing protein n=1 Tax=Acetanaerobacterium elongatum TaxID=258515 RepID=A0A1H0A986_9FIRM|nr:DUF1540 domain-containing protein [Acetanaerobacterium elongatum]SDN30168.1 protein of unknown function [Acetanaerobacterium elongatum]